MADEDATEADALARLEAALDRIADAARPGALPTAAVDTIVITEKMDALIVRLRDALSTLPAAKA